MAKRRILVFIGVLIIMLLAPFIMQRLWNYQNRFAIQEMSVDELFTSFITDKVKAYDRFLDKEVWVRGQLQGMDILSAKKAIIKLRGNNIGAVNCIIVHNNLSENLNEIQIDSELVIKGTCIGFFGDVLLANCSVYSVNKN